MPNDFWIAISSKSKAGAQPEQINGHYMDDILFDCRAEFVCKM